MASDIIESYERLFVSGPKPYSPLESPEHTFEHIHVKLANENWQADAQQVVLIMVGLPARGKSLISGKGSYGTSLDLECQC